MTIRRWHNKGENMVHVGLQPAYSMSFKYFNRTFLRVECTQSQKGVPQFHGLCFLLEEISEGHKNDLPSNNLWQENPNCSNKKLRVIFHKVKKSGFIMILCSKTISHWNWTWKLSTLEEPRISVSVQGSTLQLWHYFQQDATSMHFFFFRKFSHVISHPP